uniref:Immunoglobulin V-set domain-containing protein n=1 Tax=Sus scrofa TaxID=9823 RepID=A0A8D0QS16_PIG
MIVSSGEIVLTQSAAPKAVSQEESVIITCNGSPGVSTNKLHWYQLKTGAPPRLLIYSTSSLAFWVPTRFSGSGSGTSYSRTISSVAAQDAADYYCQQSSSFPPTWAPGGGSLCNNRKDAK